ncbi:MAG: ABC transporter ATP-binding protein [Chloroflexi bacterium]|nr:MAG: ABC transporter ATP-binding protein [Chloroflexota bacterium]
MGEANDGATRPLIRTENLTRVYRAGARRVPALQGVDLEIEPGRFIALRGRSGSGKTTLLNCIGGLDRPTSGRVWLEGREVSRLSEWRRVSIRRRRIGFVFQSFALLPTYSARENIDLMLRLVGVGRRERRRRVEEVLGLVGLEKWAGHRPFEMSGGQQQRLAIARAISTRPVLILADEPTGELDSVTGEEILTLLRRIVEEEGTTLLVASHDPNVDLYAHQVYELQDGRLVPPSG